jgi:signal transduction histidine kinase
MAFDPTQSAAVLAYVQETAPVVALTLNSGQRVVAANQHARRVLGEDLAGRTLRELVVDFTPLPPARLTDGLSPEGHLLTLNTAAGLPETYRFRFSALPNGCLALGNLDFEEQQRLRTEVLGLNRELNDLTRQLHQANAELRELNQLKNQFLGMAAHDLRRPVGALMTYTGFVLDEASEGLSTEHRGFLELCLHAATDMQRLIDDFLDVAVIESGRLRLERTPVTAGDLLNGVLELCRLVAARKQIALVVDAAGDSPAVPLDAPKVQQALVNLIGNAVEHSQPGQAVRLIARWDEPAREMVFAVRDAGPGLTSEEQARLFQPFARAGTRKTAGERSTGLGLAIARQVVQAHQGRLWVESIPGQGATFFVALPAGFADKATQIDSS